MTVDIKIAFVPCTQLLMSLTEDKEVYIDWLKTHTGAKEVELHSNRWCKCLGFKDKHSPGEGIHVVLTAPLATVDEVYIHYADRRYPKTEPVWSWYSNEELPQCLGCGAQNVVYDADTGLCESCTIDAGTQALRELKK